MSSDFAGVVVHVTSGDEGDWAQALRNLSNLYQNESVPVPPSRITVVVNGHAVRFLLARSPDADQIERIASAGVHVDACRNSLDRLGYDPENLATGVETIPSGVAEVVRLQWNGHGYLKLP
jgi:intracellular sulfur oxidation DsrE/DsrF family protein